MSVDLVREAAVEALLQVFDKGAYIDAAVDRKLRRRKMAPRGRRFFTQLVYGTVRHKLLCDHVLAPLVHRKLEELPRPIHVILRMGVFQALFCESVTFPAMVHTAVDIAKRKGHAGTARLTNAVLKKVPETLEQVELPSEPRERLSIRYSMPLWLVDRWLSQYGDEAEGVCQAMNEEAPQTIRVNAALTAPESLAAELAKAGFTVVPAPPVPEALTVADAPRPLATLKAFQNGLFFIQDVASMAAARLVEPQPGERVLDLCSAPGGKTTHLAELMAGGGVIVALDAMARRLERVVENAARLRLHNVAAVAGDGLRPPLRATFGRVLVDAPCSGLGTLRRRPDLKWRMKPEELPRLAEMQRNLLRSAIALCENGGVIVYSVCTTTPEETDDVIAHILETEPVTPEDGPAWLSAWRETAGTYRTGPHRNNTDGFYLTRLRKRS